MKYCSNCGNTVEKKIPDDDNRLRHCCDSCGSIHYLNPKVIAGTLPFIGEKVLLCKRAIQPRYGLWTLPAGFLENGETIAEGAFRETEEETNTQVKMGHLYAIFDIPQIYQVSLKSQVSVKSPVCRQKLKNLLIGLFTGSFMFVVYILQCINMVISYKTYKKLIKYILFYFFIKMGFDKKNVILRVT